MAIAKKRGDMLLPTLRIHLRAPELPPAKTRLRFNDRHHRTQFSVCKSALWQGALTPASFDLAAQVAALNARDYNRSKPQEEQHITQLRDSA